MDESLSMSSSGGCHLTNGSSTVIPFFSDSEYTLGQILPEECVLTDLQSQDYEDALAEMVLHLHRLGYVRDWKACVEDIRCRERMASTILENGLAFPHAHSAQAMRLISAIGLCHRGESQSRDVVIVLTLCPKEVIFPYIQYVGHVASVLMSLPKLQPLHDVKDVKALRGVLLGDEQER